MEAEQLLVRGLLGATQGAADQVVKEADFERETKAKEQAAALEARAKTDREAAIEFAKAQRQASLAETQHGYKMEEIKLGKSLGGGKLGRPAEAQLVDYYADIMFDGDKKKAAEWNKNSKGRSDEDRRSDFIAKALAGGMLDDAEIRAKADEWFPIPARKAAGAIPGLPAGARQIGTSGGKPVYQTPDGRKLIGE